MNQEKINELHEKAWIEESFPGSCRVTKYWSKEKFAQLLLDEVLESIEEIKKAGVPQATVGGLNLAQICIKDHFDYKIDTIKKFGL
jgi:hypothetical protein